MKEFTTTLLLSLVLSGASQAAGTSAPSKPDGEIAGHGYVDLGLPSGTLWATCNVGAEAYYYPGEYFAWGEVQARDVFKWRDYQFFEEEYTDPEGHLNYTAKEIGAVISGTEYDAARIQWGDAWRMPTREDYEELKEYCDMEYWEAAQVSPRQGLRISGPSGKSILLPYTFCPHTGINPAVLTGGDYWTSTVSESPTGDNRPAALQMSFGYEGSTLRLIPDGRHDGLCIRPVISGKAIGASVVSVSDGFAMRYEGSAVTVSSDVDGCMLNVADLSGKLFRTSNVRDGKCHLSDLSKGIYILSLQKGNQTLSTLKIAVK